MASPGEDHGHAPLVGRTDDLLIAHRTSRLNRGRGAGLSRSDQPVGEREERVACRDRDPRALADARARLLTLMDELQTIAR